MAKLKLRHEKSSLFSRMTPTPAGSLLSKSGKTPPLRRRVRVYDRRHAAGTVKLSEKDA